MILVVELENYPDKVAKVEVEFEVKVLPMLNTWKPALPEPEEEEEEEEEQSQLIIPVQVPDKVEDTQVEQLPAV